MNRRRDKARSGSYTFSEAFSAKLLRPLRGDRNASQRYLSSGTPSSSYSHSFGINPVTYNHSSQYRVLAQMPESQLTDPEVYHTSTEASFRPGKNLDHRATRMFVPFCDRHVSIPCSVGEYHHHIYHFLWVENFAQCQSPYRPRTSATACTYFAFIGATQRCTATMLRPRWSAEILPI